METKLTSSLLTSQVGHETIGVIEELSQELISAVSLTVASADDVHAGGHTSSILQVAHLNSFQASSSSEGWLSEPQSVAWHVVAVSDADVAHRHAEEQRNHQAEDEQEAGIAKDVQRREGWDPDDDLEGDEGDDAGLQRCYCERLSVHRA